MIRNGLKSSILKNNMKSSIKSKELVNNKNANLFNKNISKKTFLNFLRHGGDHKLLKYTVFFSFGIYILGIGTNQDNYVKRYLYNKQAFSSNPTSIITTHFTKITIVELLIDNLIIYSLGSSIALMSGEAILNKVILSSIGFSSLILLVFQNEKIYFKSEGIIRGLISYYFISSGLNSSIMLFPFPFQIKAAYILGFLILVDLMSNKKVNFGGLIAAGLIHRRLI